MPLTAMATASVISDIMMFIARKWKWFAAGALVIAVVVGFKIVEAQRDEWQRKEEAARIQRDQIQAQLRVSNASVGALQSQVDQQNGAISQLGKESEARLLEGRALILGEVRKGAAASAAAVKLSQNPQKGGDQSKTSDAVLAMRGDL